MKAGKIIIFFILILMISGSSFPVNTYAGEKKDPASDADQILNEQMNSDEMQQIQEQLDKILKEENAGFLQNKSPADITKDLLAGKSSFNFSDILNWVGAVLFKEFGLNLSLLIKIIVIVCIFSFLRGFQIAESKTGISETAFYASYALVIAIMCTSFIGIIDLARESISTMVQFMNYSSPALFVLVAAGGNPITAATIKPTFILAVQILANILVKFFLPLFFLIAVLTIVDNLSEKIKITNLVGVLKTAANWGLGICMTIFVAMLSIQGIISTTADGVAGKTAKFAAGTFIPVVGKYLSDSVDTVVSCAGAIKNAAGIGVMIGIIAIFAAPALKIFTIAIMYRLTGALIQPLADKRLTDCVKGMADSMNYVAGVAVLAAVLLLISVSVIIKTVV